MYLRQIFEKDVVDDISESQNQTKLQQSINHWLVTFQNQNKFSTILQLLAFGISIPKSQTYQRKSKRHWPIDIPLAIHIFN